jgi:RimJ/RimL family protein N-acetyltransferase
MLFDPGRLLLSGKAVVLRPLEVGDAEGLAAAAGESREHYGYNPVPDGLPGARDYIRRALRQRDVGERYPFTIEWHGRIVGSTSYSEFQPWSWPTGSRLQRDNRPDVCEIGYTWLAASAQRTGCNTEAKYLLLSHAFETWQVHRVSLRTDARNERSRRAIERLGAQFEGVRRGDKPATDETVRNSAFYSIVSAEWPEIRDRLRKFLTSTL